MEKSNTLIKCPNIEICKINYFFKYCLLFDFTSFTKLKELKTQINDILYLKNTSLNKIHIASDSFSTIDMEMKVLEKLILINTLEEIKIELRDINNDEISKIKDCNYNVKKLIIKLLHYNKNKCILFNLQKLFPNLYYIKLDAGFNELKKTNLIIKENLENLDCKITDIILDRIENLNIKFYCGPYESIKKIDINLSDSQVIFNLKNSFPIFTKNNNIIFRSLMEFRLYQTNNSYFNFSLNTLNSIYNNLKNMPNLKIFGLSVVSSDIDEDFHTKFVKRLLKLDLKYIEFSIRYYLHSKNRQYTNEELKQIYSKTNFKNYDYINIKNYSKTSFIDTIRYYSKINLNTFEI